MLLVVVTALVVAFVATQAINRQIEYSADRELADGVTLFQTSLEDSGEDLLAAADWLVHDPDLNSAIQAQQAAIARERLALALRFKAVDEVLVVDLSGDVLARLRVDEQRGVDDPIADSPGFREALAGYTVTGIAQRGVDFLRQDAYLPMFGPNGGAPVGVVRVSSFLDQQLLDRFRARTGLEFSLFLGESRVVSTLRQDDGPPLHGIGADPEIYQQVVGLGQSLVTWRDLPSGRIRSYYVPLNSADGQPVGMLAVALPLQDIEGELRSQVLYIWPLTLLTIIAGAAFAYVLATKVREPILALASAAARLRSGDLTTPIPLVQEPELEPLAAELEQARRSVQASLEAITNEEARQRALIATIRDPLITTALDGRITDCNAAARSLLGRQQRLAGRQIRDLLPFLPDPALDRSNSSQAATWQGRVAGLAGEPIDVEVSRVTLAKGNLPAAHVYTIHDVSRYAELNRLREQLLYNVAHELRGPLAVLDNTLDIVAAEYGDLSADELGQLLATARSTSKRFSSLIENLLSAGTIRSGRLIVRRQPIAVHDILAAIADDVELLISARRQRLVLESTCPDLAIFGDRRYLRQVIENLISNASKYSPDGETITVRAQSVPNAVRIAVIDRGCGIPTDRQAGIFDRFYRVHPSDETPGIGLGLAIAKSIITAHGGQIGLESAPGAGTTVWLTLPLAKGDDEQDSAR